MLITASVIGREFGFELLDKLTDGLSQKALLHLLEGSLHAGIIEEVLDLVVTYQFNVNNG